MKLPRLSTLLCIAGAAAAAAVLFWTSQNVQQAEDRLARLKGGVESERQSIRVLNAEWDYLNRPDRLEALAMQYLGLSTPASAYSVSDDMTGLPDPFVPALPPRKPLMDARAVSLQEVAPAAGAENAAQPPAEEYPFPQAEREDSFDALLQDLEKGGRR